MPVVPLPDGQQARLGGVPQGRIVAPQIDDTGARQTMAFGGALQELGGAAGRIAADMQAQADEVRITDALNRVKEQALTLQHDKDVGYLSVRGRDAFERADGKPFVRPLCPYPARAVYKGGNADPASPGAFECAR